MYAEVITAGIIVSLVFSELTQLSPAGLIVPGYLVLNLASPLKLLFTFAVAFISCGLYAMLSRYAILYGRRRFAVMILLSLGVAKLITLLLVPAADVGVIGYLIPGIIAKDFSAQGVGKTMLSTAAVTLITAVICLLFGVILF